MYWFNLLQIPPEDKSEQKEGTAQIAISFLNQVKLLYRPTTIDGDVHDLPNRLEFSLSRDEKTWRITAKNPTGFYATFVDIAHLLSGSEILPVDLGHEVTLAPFSSRTWRVAGSKMSILSPVFEFSLIDDSGSPKSSRKPVAIMP
ncbi:hypothetical protein WJ32_19005 (plasmid) [Burkholderia ubonensis]|uniref:Uncharacterized protein n=1 Tax=Burkholderia ubonensis TaxID=101571 RepID=A0A103RZT7_9BURK|nr:hypothetical protein WJ32_19005 [Burkholderia ubonensis]KVG77027.1 hypothetical protein WJ33_01620 [Burkholderia ubonensis]